MRPTTSTEPVVLDRLQKEMEIVKGGGLGIFRGGWYVGAKILVSKASTSVMWWLGCAASTGKSELRPHSTCTSPGLPLLNPPFLACDSSAFATIATCTNHKQLLAQDLPLSKSCKINWPRSIEQACQEYSKKHYKGLDPIHTRPFIQEQHIHLTEADSQSHCD